MFLAQVAIAFAIWLGYGYWLYRRSKRVLAFVLSIPKRRRAVLAPLFLLLGLVSMGAGVVLVEVLGGFSAQGVHWIGWLSLVTIGVFFVRTQVLAAAMMATLAGSGVTNPAQHPSVTRDSQHENN